MEQSPFEFMDMGSCCVCGRHDHTVSTIIMLEFKMPPGCKSGWGCLVCGLDPVGAVAVVCNECLKGDLNIVNLRIKFIAGPGHLKDNNRVPYDSFEKIPHGHDYFKHALDE